MKDLVYHATPVWNLKDIVAKGLVTNDGSRGIWPDELPVIGYLFCCETMEGARYYQEQMGSDETVVLRFPRPGDSRTDPHGDMVGELRSERAVPASVIEVEIVGAWRPVGDVPASFMH